MSALSRVHNPHGRAAVRLKVCCGIDTGEIRVAADSKPRIRRLDIGMTPAAPAGSTVTVHDVAHLGNPDANLARKYGLSLSPEQNLARAFNAKRLDHAEVWATLAGLLAEQPPPPYSVLPPLDRDAGVRRDRETWERGMARKKLVLNQL
jgi:hypothetical protein